jgi:hypothetical protein
MKNKLFIFVPISVFLFIAAFMVVGCSGTKWANKDYNAIKSGIDTVSIVFPHVEYYEKSGEAKIIKTGHSVFVSRKVADVLKEIIDNEHSIAKSAVLICDSMVIDQWMPTCFSNSIVSYKRICDSMLKSESGKKVFQITSDLQPLIDKVTTKYFLFVNGTAYGTTEETKRYDFNQAQTFKLLYDRPFIYDYQWSGLQLHVYLVDKETKELLWHNSNDSRDTKYDPIKEEEVKELCKKLVQVN